MNALDDIAAERRRQIEVEGWSPRHDDKHANGQLAGAAATYAMAAGVHDGDRGMLNFPSRFDLYSNDAITAFKLLWPWSTSWWKPTSRRRDLVKAGALIVAEIERLDRAEARERAAP
ncbi:MAG: hypothetical protein KDJ90_06750 [Nitratireductor sp.]|nr:hypothetical protein [Nitratireductor sp.]